MKDLILKSLIVFVFYFWSSGIVCLRVLSCTSCIALQFFSEKCSNKIEVAYQEAIAWKRQEELIREEEEAWLAGSEQKAKRGAAEKEKKSKKKQVLTPLLLPK